jgi:hypothetical protein
MIFDDTQNEHPQQHLRITMLYISEKNLSCIGKQKEHDI